MTIMDDALPGIKRFLLKAVLSDHALGYFTRMITAFIFHLGRMSAQQAASSVRSAARHRAQVARFLANERGIKDWFVCYQQAVLLLEQQQRGRWLFLLDQTLCSQQGEKTQNTYSTGNRTRRPKKNRRYSKKKRAAKRCHCFVMGLLITPSGLRIPCFQSYLTQEYCEQKQLVYRKQTALAADLIREVAVPQGVTVTVLGDTAFEAKTIRSACNDRGFTWIVPLNPERVLAGEKPRPKVRSLIEGFSAQQFAKVRLVPSAGKYVAQRRLSRCRIGPKVKARTFWVHQERTEVHNVGFVQLVFSTKEKPQAGKALGVQKILMSNDVKLKARELVELYDLRWQIELFFKECKSHLGLHQYNFRNFDKVQNWVRLCLITFLYLEWYRANQLKKRSLSDAARQFWQCQRTHGLCQAIRQLTEEGEIRRMAQFASTKHGMRRLRKLLRAAQPLEQRIPE